MSAVRTLVNFRHFSFSAQKLNNRKMHKRLNPVLDSILCLHHDGSSAALQSRTGPRATINCSSKQKMMHPLRTASINARLTMSDYLLLKMRTGKSLPKNFLNRAKSFCSKQSYRFFVQFQLVLTVRDAATKPCMIENRIELAAPLYGTGFKSSREFGLGLAAFFSRLRPGTAELVNNDEVSSNSKTTCNN